MSRPDMAPWSPGDRFRPLDRLTRAVTTMLGVVGLLSLSIVPTLVVELHRVRGRHEYLLEQEWLGRLSSALLTATSVAWVAAAGFWLVWQARAHENLWAARAPGLWSRPAWSVLWWLVPVANLWMPALVVREIARGSAAAAGRRPGPEASLALWLWWVPWVFASLSWLAGTIARKTAIVTQDRALFRQGDRALILSACLTVFCAVLAAIVVREIGADQSGVSAAFAAGGAMSETGAPSRPDLGDRAAN